MTRKQLVHTLAQFVVKSNLENYKDNCNCPDCDKPDPIIFSEFGTSTETVEIIIGELVGEVAIETKRIQEEIGPILFD